MNAKRIYKIDSLKEGWSLLKNNFEILLGAFVFMIVASIVMQLIADRPMASYNDAGLAPPLNAVFFVLIISLAQMSLNMILQMGFTKILLKIIRGQKAFFNDMLSCYKLFFNYLLGNILYFLIVLFGCSFIFLFAFVVALNPGLREALGSLDSASGIQALLMVVFIVGGVCLLLFPMVYLSIRYGFFAIAIVDKGLGPVASLNESARITDGALWEIALFHLFLFGFNILGALSLIVGLIITVPISIIAYMIAYRMLLEQSDEEDDPTMTREAVQET